MNKEIELDALVSNIEENSKFFYLIQPITKNMAIETMQTCFNWLAKFLKESVSALRELFDLLSEQDGSPTNDGIAIVVEKSIGEWNK